VNFEAEGSGKEMFATVKQLLNGNMSDPTLPSYDKVTIKTSMGNIDLRVEDLAPLLEKVRRLHFVSYNAVPNEDPFKRYEKQFVAAGLQRIAYVPGASGVLITRHIGKVDSYGIVVRQKDNIVVLRTEGAPGLGDIGKPLFEALSRAVQQAVKDKVHH